jgi:predicted PurR-regulated permease PerM
MISTRLFAVTAIIYGIITSVLSFIPYIGRVLVLIIAPLFSIFCARHFTLVYDSGVPQPVLPEAAL